MTENELSTVLTLVKQRLDRMSEDTSRDSYLTYRIRGEARALQDAGIALDVAGNPDHLMHLVDMAVWAYQNRDKPESMPKWLRLRRRELWLQQNAKRGEGRS